MKHYSFKQKFPVALGAIVLIASSFVLPANQANADSGGGNGGHGHGGPLYVMPVSPAMYMLASQQVGKGYQEGTERGGMVIEDQPHLFLAGVYADNGGGNGGGTHAGNDGGNSGNKKA